MISYIGQLWLAFYDWSILICWSGLGDWFKIIKYWGLIYILILIFIHLLKNLVLSIKLNIYITCWIYVTHRDVYNTFSNWLMALSMKCTLKISLSLSILSLQRLLATLLIPRIFVLSLVNTILLYDRLKNCTIDEVYVDVYSSKIS